MNNPNLNQYSEQLETYVAGPARAFAGLTVDHLERVVQTQVAAGKAYSEVGLKQLRAALDVKDPQDLQAYAQGQQKAAQDLVEQIKGDVQKFAELNKDFVEKAQKLSQDNVQSASKAAEKGVKDVQKATTKASSGAQASS